MLSNAYLYITWKYKNVFITLKINKLAQPFELLDAGLYISPFCKTDYCGLVCFPHSMQVSVSKQ